MTTKILIIEPDEITRFLLAKEVEQTKKIPILAENRKEAMEIISQHRISIIVCDDDYSECNILAELIRDMGYAIPFIKTSTFLHNKKFVEENGVICILQKPLDSEGYNILKEKIKDLKKI